MWERGGKRERGGVFLRSSRSHLTKQPRPLGGGSGGVGTLGGSRWRALLDSRRDGGGCGCGAGLLFWGRGGHGGAPGGGSSSLTGHRIGVRWVWLIGFERRSGLRMRLIGLD